MITDQLYTESILSCRVYQRKHASGCTGYLHVIIYMGLSNSVIMKRYLKKDQDEYIYISTDVSDVRFIMSGNMCTDM